MRKAFKVLAVLGSRAVLGIPAVVLVARDGEGWEVHTAYHKGTMKPIKPGDIVEVEYAARRGGYPEYREVSEEGWLREGYECPHGMGRAPEAVAAALWKPTPAPTPKAAACEGCDCSDPTAVAGLAADCGCRCHPAPPAKAKPVKAKPYDEIGQIIAYEGGDLSPEETVTLFAHLIRTGRAWTLQGHYGRTAATLIDSGYIARDGTILKTEYPA